MSGKIVNLNKARKTRERERSRRDADANAARYGRTKAERAAAATEESRRSGHLEGHRRDREEE